METENKIGFFEEKVPNNFSMTRLLSFIISVVSLSTWALANMAKFAVLAMSDKVTPSDVTLVPMPESVLLLVTGGLTLKFIQKKFAENGGGVNNDSQAGK